MSFLKFIWVCEEESSVNSFSDFCLQDIKRKETINKLKNNIEQLELELKQAQITRGYT